ncbi:MAG: hypothetical protein Q8896_00010 [Bacteroidota bacterium]|nr:hypothetical protein [Bacteroidota bacterium]MDP4235494.1 hypothetical protein [Bacteroidota bacterium]
MKPQSFALLLILGFALFPGCKSNPAAPSSDQNGNLSNIYPMKVGDSWVYRQQTFDVNGTSVQDETGTVLISGEETYQGHHAYHYGILNVPGYALVYWVDSDLYSFDPNDSTSTPHMVLRYPMNVGESLTLFDSSIGGALRVKETATLVKTGQPISTPAGNFSCVQFRIVNEYIYPQNIVDTNSVSDKFYADGVGLVLGRDYQYASSAHYLDGTFELQSFSLK